MVRFSNRNILFNFFLLDLLIYKDSYGEENKVCDCIKSASKEVDLFIFCYNPSFEKPTVCLKTK